MSAAADRGAPGPEAEARPRPLPERTSTAIRRLAAARSRANAERASAKGLVSVSRVWENAFGDDDGGVGDSSRAEGRVRFGRAGDAAEAGAPDSKCASPPRAGSSASPRRSFLIASRVDMYNSLASRGSADEAGGLASKPSSPPLSRGSSYASPAQSPPRSPSAVRGSSDSHAPLLSDGSPPSSPYRYVRIRRGEPFAVGPVAAEAEGRPVVGLARVETEGRPVVELAKVEAKDHPVVGSMEREAQEPFESMLAGGAARGAASTAPVRAGKVDLSGTNALAGGGPVQASAASLAGFDSTSPIPIPSAGASRALRQPGRSTWSLPHGAKESTKGMGEKAEVGLDGVASVATAPGRGRRGAADASLSRDLPVEGETVGRGGVRISAFSAARAGTGDVQVQSPDGQVPPASVSDAQPLPVLAVANWSTKPIAPAALIRRSHRRLAAQFADMGAIRAALGGSKGSPDARESVGGCAGSGTPRGTKAELEEGVSEDAGRGESEGTSGGVSPGKGEGTSRGLGDGEGTSRGLGDGEGTSRGLGDGEGMSQGPDANKGTSRGAEMGADAVSRESDATATEPRQSAPALSAAVAEPHQPAAGLSTTAVGRPPGVSPPPLPQPHDDRSSILRSHAVTRILSMASLASQEGDPDGKGCRRLAGPLAAKVPRTRSAPSRTSGPERTSSASPLPAPECPPPSAARLAALELEIVDLARALEAALAEHERRGVELKALRQEAEEAREQAARSDARALELAEAVIAAEARAASVARALAVTERRLAEEREARGGAEAEAGARENGRDGVQKRVAEKEPKGERAEGRVGGGERLQEPLPEPRSRAPPRSSSGPVSLQPPDSSPASTPLHPPDSSPTPTPLQAALRAATTEVAQTLSKELEASRLESENLRAALADARRAVDAGETAQRGLRRLLDEQVAATKEALEVAKAFEDKARALQKKRAEDGVGSGESKGAGGVGRGGNKGAGGVVTSGSPAAEARPHEAVFGATTAEASALLVEAESRLLVQRGEHELRVRTLQHELNEERSARERAEAGAEREREKAREAEKTWEAKLTSTNEAWAITVEHVREEESQKRADAEASSRRRRNFDQAVQKGPCAPAHGETVQKGSGDQTPANSMCDNGEDQTRDAGAPSVPGGEASKAARKREIERRLLALQARCEDAASEAAEAKAAVERERKRSAALARDLAASERTVAALRESLEALDREFRSLRESSTAALATAEASAAADLEVCKTAAAMDIVRSRQRVRELEQDLEDAKRQLADVLRSEEEEVEGAEQAGAKADLGTALLRTSGGGPETTPPAAGTEPPFSPPRDSEAPTLASQTVVDRPSPTPNALPDGPGPSSETSPLSVDSHTDTPPQIESAPSSARRPRPKTEPVDGALQGTSVQYDATPSSSPAAAESLEGPVSTASPPATGRPGAPHEPSPPGASQLHLLHHRASSTPVSHLHRVSIFSSSASASAAGCLQPLPLRGLHPSPRLPAMASASLPPPPLPRACASLPPSLWRRTSCASFVAASSPATSIQSLLDAAKREVSLAMASTEAFAQRHARNSARRSARGGEESSDGARAFESWGERCGGGGAVEEAGDELGRLESAIGREATLDAADAGGRPERQELGTAGGSDGRGAEKASRRVVADDCETTAEARPGSAETVGGDTGGAGAMAKALEHVGEGIEAKAHGAAKPGTEAKAHGAAKPGTEAKAHGAAKPGTEAKAHMTAKAGAESTSRKGVSPEGTTGERAPAAAVGKAGQNLDEKTEGEARAQGAEERTDASVDSIATQDVRTGDAVADARPVAPPGSASQRRPAPASLPSPAPSLPPLSLPTSTLFPSAPSSLTASQSWLSADPSHSPAHMPTPSPQSSGHLPPRGPSRLREERSFPPPSRAHDALDPPRPSVASMSCASASAQTVSRLTLSTTSLELSESTYGHLSTPDLLPEPSSARAGGAARAESSAGSAFGVAASGGSEAGLPRAIAVERNQAQGVARRESEPATAAAPIALDAAAAGMQRRAATDGPGDGACNGGTQADWSAHEEVGGRMRGVAPSATASAGCPDPAGRTSTSHASTSQAPLVAVPPASASIHPSRAAEPSADGTPGAATAVPAVTAAAPLDRTMPCAPASGRAGQSPRPPSSPRTACDSRASPARVAVLRQAPARGRVAENPLSAHLDVSVPSRVADVPPARSPMHANASLRTTPPDHSRSSPPSPRVLAAPPTLPASPRARTADRVEDRPFAGPQPPSAPPSALWSPRQAALRDADFSARASGSCAKRSPPDAYGDGPVEVPMLDQTECAVDARADAGRSRAAGAGRVRSSPSLSGWNVPLVPPAPVPPASSEIQAAEPVLAIEVDRVAEPHASRVETVTVEETPIARVEVHKVEETPVSRVEALQSTEPKVVAPAPIAAPVSAAVETDTDPAPTWPAVARRPPAISTSSARHRAQAAPTPSRPRGPPPSPRRYGDLPGFSAARKALKARRDASSHSSSSFVKRVLGAAAFPDSRPGAVGAAVDALVDALAEAGVQVPLERCGAREWALGSARATVRVVNGVPSARSGAGSIPLIDWIAQKPIFAPTAGKRSTADDAEVGEGRIRTWAGIGSLDPTRAA